jgi:hypothetical protein
MRYMPVPGPPCPHCGEPGWHASVEQCLAALRKAIVVELGKQQPQKVA